MVLNKNKSEIATSFRNLLRKADEMALEKKKDELIDNTKTFYKNDAKINNEKLIKFINNSQNNVSFTKDNILMYKKTFSDIRDKKIVIANIINKII